MSAVDQSLQVLRGRGLTDSVEIAILLGSGLGGVAEGLAGAVSIPYVELPAMPQIAASEHHGRLVAGRLENVNVCFLQGQAHFHDAGDPACMSEALALVKALGARQLLVFAGAGAVRPDLYPGNLALVTDHIGLGLNPLIGMADSGAFLSLNEAHDPRILRRMKRGAAIAGVTVHDGVYLWVSGPTFPTPAESRMARTLGADLVGFALVPEIILARRLGLRAAAVAVVTHFSAGVQGADPDPIECRQQALAGSIGLRRLLRSYLKSAEAVA